MVNFKKKDIFIGTLIFIIIFVYFLLFIHYPERRSWRDEGTFYYGAERILKGQLIYRDFSEIQFPGSFYLLAGAFKLVGNRFETGRIITYFCISVALILYYLLSRTVGISVAFALLPVSLITFFGFPQWAGSLPHWFSFFSTALSIFLLNSYILSKSKKFLVLSGLFSGVTLNFIQNEGALLLAGILFFLIFDGIFLRKSELKLIKHELILFLSSFFIIAMLFPVYFLVKGEFYSFVYSTFFYLFEKYLPANKIPYFGYFANLVASDLLEQSRNINNIFLLLFIYTVIFLVLLVQYGLPVIYLLSSIILFLFRNKIGHLFFRQSFMLTVVGCFLFLSQIHKPDPIRLMFVSLPATILASAALHNIHKKFPFVSLVFIIPIYSVVLTYGILTSYRIHKDYICFVDAPGGKIYFNKNEICDELKVLQRIVSESSENNIVYIHNWAAQYYFLFKWENPVPYDGLLNGHNSSEQFDLSKKILENSPPKFIVTDNVLEYLVKHPDKSPFPTINSEVLKNDPIWDYIMSNYISIVRFPSSGLILWRRRDE